jgi:hypothetical protein
MLRRLPFLAVGALLWTGCGGTYCESIGLYIAVWNPPPDVVGYTFELQFENRTVEFACAPEPSKPGSCEATAGPWRIAAVVFPAPPPDEMVSPIALSIHRRDDFSTYVPKGEVRVALSAPGFHAERAFIASVESSSDCQYAYEDWDLAEE